MFFEQAAAIVTRHALEMGQESRPGGKEGLVPRPLGQFSADLVLFPKGYTKPALPPPSLCTQPWYRFTVTPVLNIHNIHTATRNDVCLYMRGMPVCVCVCVHVRVSVRTSPCVCPCRATASDS